MKSLFIQLAIFGRRLSYRILSWLTPFFGKRRNGALIFCYHAIGDDAWRFGLSKETFIAQVEYLERKGYRFLSLEEVWARLSRGQALAPRTAVLTFDDGYRDVLLVKAYLARQRIKPALFVLARQDQANWEELGGRRALLSRDELRELRA